MREKRNWTGKFIFIMLLPAFMAAVFLHAVNSKAADAGGDNAIGTYNDAAGGASTTGVKVSKNGQTIYYALDTWKKESDGTWKYTGSNVDGYTGIIETSASSPVYIKGTSETRFGININKIKEYMPERGSVVIKKYVYGKCTYNRAEFTYQDNKDNEVDISESLLKQLKNGAVNLDLDATKYKYNSVSYLYNIYDAAVISRNGDIKADIPSGCTILSEGYAYYGIEDGYIIKELPQIEHDPEEGVTFTFKGWYTSPSGGDEVSAGDAIETGTTIYPQWDRTVNSYNVNYIDILGSSPDGQVLGTKTLTLNYNSETSGSDIGNDHAAGAYYKGFCYTGSTSVTVKSDCDVYRYFRPVSYNIIFNGNNAVSGATAPLNGCMYSEEYLLPANGYNRNGIVILDLNARDAACATREINIPYKFTGWSDTASGSVVYADCGKVSNLCETDGTKQLYAVWEGGSIEIGATPVREGYNFSGWSKEQDSKEGSTYFDVSDVNNCTLYAVWKPLKAKYSVAYYIWDNMDGYILGHTAEYEAFTGYEADCSSDLYIEQHYSQYILDKDKSIYKGTVKYDGSLLLECYLKKKNGNGDNTNTGNGTGGTTGGDASQGNTSGGSIGGGTNTGNGGSGNINSGSGNNSSGGSISGGNTGNGTGGTTGGNGSQGSTSSGNTGGNTNTGNGGSGNINSGSSNNSSGGSISGGSTGSGSVGNTGSGGTGGAGGSSTGSGGAGSTGSSSAGSGGTGSAGSGSTGSTGGSSTGNGGAGSAGGGSTGSTGSSSAGNTSGGSITSGNSGNGASVSVNNKIHGSTSGSSIKDNGSNNKKENNTSHNGVNEDTLNKRGSSKNKNVSYPKPGKKYTKSGIVYKIVKSSKKTKTAKVVKAKNTIRKAKIPACIKIKGYKYKVVSISKNAFVKCGKLKKAVIGKNIKSIGKKAFYKDKKLGNIKIKSKKIKSIGKGAFKSIKPRCTVKIAGSRKYARKVFSMISAKG